MDEYESQRKDLPINAQTLYFPSFIICNLHASVWS